MKLRTDTSKAPSSLQLVSDPPRGRRRVSRQSLSRIFYLLLLMAGAVLGLQFLVGLMFVATAPGIMHAGLLEIGSDRGGRILAITAQEGVPVKKGAVLATIAVPGGDEAVQLAAATVKRLEAQIQAERNRATAQGQAEASRLLAQIADLRDRGLAAQAERSGILVLMKSLNAQIQEINTSIVAFDVLSQREIKATHSYLDLRVQKLALEGKRDSLAEHARVLDSRIQQLMLEMGRQKRVVEATQKTALAASDVALLKAQLAEARSQFDLRKGLATTEITASEDGMVSWFQLRAGEVVVAGAPILQFVPNRSATAVVYPGDKLDGFPLHAVVDIAGAGFRAKGTVIEVSVADRERPVSLLKPYEKAVVGPAVLVRIDSVSQGRLRAGAEIKVSRAQLSFLHWIGL